VDFGAATAPLYLPLIPIPLDLSSGRRENQRDAIAFPTSRGLFIHVGRFYSFAEHLGFGTMADRVAGNIPNGDSASVEIGWHNADATYRCRS